MGCSGNCYPLFLIAFNINPPIIAIGMETESETGSRNAPNIPPKIVQTTARAIISGLHNFQNMFSVVKSYVVQHEFVFDWIKISIAHLFGIAKRKRNSGFPLFLLYIREQNYKPGSVFDSHLSRRTVAGTLKPPRERPGKPWGRSPCSHTGVAPDRVYSDGHFHEPSGELLPRLSTLTPPTQASARRYLSVALFLKSPSAGVTRYPCPMEPGLSSWTGFRPVPAAVQRTRSLHCSEGGGESQRKFTALAGSAAFSPAVRPPPADSPCGSAPRPFCTASPRPTASPLPAGGA